MNTHTHALTWAGALFMASALTIGAPIDLTVDPAQSSLNLSITVDIGVASDTDTDSSTLSGTLEMDFDDAGNPTSISLVDMVVIIDQPMHYNWSFGFFGSADAALTDGTVLYALPGSPTGPVPVAAGLFMFPEILIDLGGQLKVNYDILLVGSGSELVDLGQQGSIGSEFSGNVSVIGDTITVSSTLPFDSTQPLVDSNGNEIGTVTTVGTATIVAAGTVPACAADLNGDGELNFFDVSAFLGAFAAMDPAADMNGDGLYNFFDVSAFLAAFAAGCP